MNTPIHAIQEHNNSNNHFYMKREDLLPFSMGGNKVRIAKVFLEDMRAQGCDGMLLYGNVRSNLCRVLANMCYREQVPCYMICSYDEQELQALDKEEPANNFLMVNWMNVKIVSCKKTEIAQTVSNTMDLMRQKGLNPYYIYGNQFGVGNEGVPVRAYCDAYQEILDWEKENQLHFDYIFVASGTCATQTGLICGHLLAKDDRTIVGISVSKDKERGERTIRAGIDSYFQKEGIHMIYDAEKEIIFSDECQQKNYKRSDPEMVSCIKDMFLYNGIPLDSTYTGKAYLGMQQYIKANHIHDAKILFIHTGGTPIFYDALHTKEYQA